MFLRCSVNILCSSGSRLFALSLTSSFGKLNTNKKFHRETLVKYKLSVMLGEISGLILQTLIHINSSCFKSAVVHINETSHVRGI